VRRPKTKQWSFVVISYNSVVATLYVDGFLVANKTLDTPGIPVNMNAPTIGAYQFQDQSYTNQANMVIHSVRAWGQMVDGTDVCPNGKEKNLLFFLEFVDNECSEVVPDLSGKEHHGTIVSATYSPTVPDSRYRYCHLPGGKPPPEVCENPTYLDFNGEYSRLTLGEVQWVDLDNLPTAATIEVVIMFQNLQDSHAIWTDDSYDLGGMHLDLYEGRIRFRVNGNTDTTFFFQPIVDTWYGLAVVYEADVGVTLFVDGLQEEKVPRVGTHHHAFACLAATNVLDADLTHLHANFTYARSLARTHKVCWSNTHRPSGSLWLHVAPLDPSVPLSTAP